MVLNQKGFTLTELLVAMAMSLVVLGAARTMYTIQAHTIKSQETQMEAEEYARVSLDIMAREIRNVGYFPGRTPCAPATAADAGLVTASDTAIRIIYDTAPSTSPCTAVQDVTYTYDAAAKNILRNGQTLTNGNVTAFQLMYYPRQTGATAPPPYCSSGGSPAGCSGTLASNLATVQRVYVSLTVKLQHTDTTVGGQHDVAMNSSINLRNRVN